MKGRIYMIKKIVDCIKNIEKNILGIMFKGFNFSFIISILSIIVLLFYIFNPVSYIILESGVLLFRISLIFEACFFIFAIFINKIKKET